MRTLDSCDVAGLPLLDADLDGLFAEVDEILCAAMAVAQCPPALPRLALAPDGARGRRPSAEVATLRGRIPAHRPHPRERGPPRG
ncbi:hypothetical protein [Nocardia sputorum]|uniref:DUF222 domain-containing protein n=1 Tax=Nocardia sputorum TaxID=2984338 RepID=A0ABM8CUI7_9NOCA|nr:hypothetical protein [Nocardia sputorum]BDT96877.1 hypothetical protein IFM12275_68530 [Nocardia sputorum]BDT98627.1 hypothetical protein IFM12276_16560 [Nocardia sputorum]